MMFDALYIGSGEYDETFEITNDTGQVIGRCGVGFAAQVEEQPVAFDIWLQPAAAEHPQLAFLLTPYAMDDSGIYHTLEGGGRVERLRKGGRVSLSGGGLYLDAHVTDIMFGQQPIDVFARPTILDKLLGRERAPVTVLAPHDYVTRLAVSLSITEGTS